MSIEIDKVQKVWKSSSERNFLENGAHFQNLKRNYLGLQNFPELRARGKPSTRLPRGRHVETERIAHRKDEHE